MKHIHLFGVLTLTTVLAACGGSDDGSTDSNEPEIKAGTVEVVEITSNNQRIGEERYEYMEISQDGALSATALDPTQSTGQYYPILTSANYQSDLVSGNQPNPQAQEFFTSLWNAINHHYGSKLSPQEIVAQIEDLDGTLESIYSDFSKSGLTIAEYIDLFEQIDTYFTEEFDELKLRNFLAHKALTPAQFILQLRSAGLTPGEFFAAMKQANLGTSDLDAYYAKIFTPELQSQALLSVSTDSFASNALTSAGGSESEELKKLLDGQEIHLALTVDQLHTVFSSGGTTASEVFKKIKSGISTAFNTLGNFFKFAWGTYTVLPFTWDSNLAATGGTEVSSNEIHYRGKIGFVTTYEFKIKLNAVVGANIKDYPAAKVVKQISTSVTNAKARPFSAWGIGGFNADALVTPSTMNIGGFPFVNNTHLVLVTGGALIKTGKNTHTIVLSSLVSGDPPTAALPFTLNANKQ